MNETNVPSIAGARILIVDDMVANLGVLQQILEGDGYQVFAATSGERALEIACKFVPDLIVLDVMMPGIGGLETCRRLKARTDTLAIPVIFITALTDIADVVEGFRAGAVDYVHKPFRHEEVSLRVRTHLQMCSYLSAYRAEAERCRAIVNNMGEGMLQIASDGVIRSVNPAAVMLLGASASALVGMAVTDLLTPLSGERYREFFASDVNSVHRLSGLRHGPHEVQLRAQYGAGMSIDLTVTEVHWGDAMYLVLLHDISSHKRSHEELASIANTDPLTGLGNRRRLDEFLALEWQRALRSGSVISLVMFDIDHFKQYNDSHGHQAGDRALQQVARAIRSVGHRPTDLAARFGGEEFVLVLIDTDAAAAVSLANEACRAVQTLDLPHSASSTAACITISAGVSGCVPTIDGALDRLLAAADGALYRAKKLGRNRAELAA